MKSMKQLFQIFTLPLVIAGFIFCSCKKERSCEGCMDTKKPPIALAGTDHTMTLPTDSILLDGYASNDADGSIAVWRWTNISGPASGGTSFQIVNPAIAKTTVRNLVAGTYQFELKVTDNDGLNANDTVLVIVNKKEPATNC